MSAPVEVTAPVGLGRRWTIDDLQTLDDERYRYELVDGNLQVTPTPTHWHQWQGHDLAQQLRAGAPSGWWVMSEFSLTTSIHDLRVPDLLVHRWPLQHPSEHPRYPMAPADVGLVVEVVSPSSRKTDRFAKPGEYAEAGIALFWRLETDPDVVLHTYELDERGPDGRVYRPTGTLTGRGRVAAPWGELELVVEPVQL